MAKRLTKKEQAARSARIQAEYEALRAARTHRKEGAMSAAIYFEPADGGWYWQHGDRDPVGPFPTECEAEADARLASMED